jgi:hypothetical protein
MRRTDNTALKLAVRQDTVGNWVTTRFSAEDPLPKNIWSRWLKESHAGATESGRTRKKSARRKKA